MALKKGINVRHGMQFGDRGATSASELAYDANTTTKQKIDALATEVAGKADLTDLAPAFSTATAYTLGKYVSYDGNIYKCTSAHSAGAWVAGDFTLVAVGSELEGKQDTLTFDNAPTDGSNNPVKSDGIYDALAGKQDVFDRISYADWQLLSQQQQAAKPYYIYDYPSTQITAANVSYDHTQSGLSATTAQGGIDELASEKQDATDNSLQTTDKTIVGGINELKSGLTNLVQTYTAENVTFSANGNALTTLPIASKVLCALIDADATSSIVGTVYKAVGNDGYVYGLHAFRASSTEDLFTGTANVTVYYI